MAKRHYEKMEVVYVPGKGLTPLPKKQADELLEPVIEELKARRMAKEIQEKKEYARRKGTRRAKKEA